MLGYAALVTRFMSSDLRQEIAFALCSALTRAKSCTHALPDTLLDHLFPESETTKLWQVAEMDEVQKNSLRVLLSTKHWNSWMLTPRFIPNELVGQEYFAALQAFVDEVKADVPDAEDWIGRSGNVSTWDLISIGSGGLALCGSPSLEAAEAAQQLRTAALHLV